MSKSNFLSKARSQKVELHRIGNESISSLINEKEKFIKKNLKECRNFLFNTFIAHSLLSLEFDCEFKLLFWEYIFFYYPNNKISQHRL